MKMRTSMGMKTVLLASALLFPTLSFAQNLSFKEIEARVSGVPQLAGPGRVQRFPPMGAAR